MSAPESTVDLLAPVRLRALGPSPLAPHHVRLDCNWLALYLPALALQVFERAAASPLPLAISEEGRIIARNDAARALGVQAGLADGAARALAADLRILPRRPALERAALERLAAWALGFSDLVSLDLEPVRPAALVLEARRSLRLFGGAESLYRHVLEGARVLGWRVRGVLAPTAAGALTLAAAGHDGLTPSYGALRQALSALHPAMLRLDRQALDDLASMGVHSIGDLLRLPRAGLAERFGPALLKRIERLLGERADPRRAFVAPERFQAELELPVEVPDAGALIFACRRLLDELGGFLSARQGGVQRLDWCLMHADSEPTRFQLGAARPERDPARWLDLLRERLGHLQLPAPVRAIGLSSETLSPLLPSTKELLIGGAAAVVPDPLLLDRLRARLGECAVRGLALVADHRPERAWRWISPDVGLSSTDRSAARKVTGVDQGADAKTKLLARAERPLWLLAEPLLLELRNRRPWLDGPLSLGSCCERIETGWWDGFEIARDYYIATTPHGERLWVYREMRGERRWFLHGLMGCCDK